MSLTLDQMICRGWAYHLTEWPITHEKTVFMVAAQGFPEEIVKDHLLRAQAAGCTIVIRRGDKLLRRLTETMAVGVVIAPIKPRKIPVYAESFWSADHVVVFHDVNSATTEAWIKQARRIPQWESKLHVVKWGEKKKPVRKVKVNTAE